MRLLPPRASSIVLAASRSAVPLPIVRRLSTTKPFLFSINTWPHVAQPRFPASRLLQQARIGIRRGLVGLVRSLLAAEVHLGVASRLSRVLRPLILGLKALLRRPRFNQGPVDSEVLVRQQSLLPCLISDLAEELRGHIRADQSISVFGEGGMIPHFVVNRQANKPTEQHVESNCSMRSRSLRMEYNT